jgi:hypothetical protein
VFIALCANSSGLGGDLTALGNDLADRVTTGPQPAGWYELMAD